MLTDSSDAPLILVVEDDSLHVSAIQRSFENSEDEFRLKIVGSLHDARAAMISHHPDLVITDYMLPDGNGNQLLFTANGLCPVILMTSQGNEQVAVDAIKAGAQDYIVKSAAAFETLPFTATYDLAAWKLGTSRRIADEAVRLAKQDWEQTFDAVPDLISIIDSRCTIIRVNKAMADRCGLTPDQLIGRKCHEVMHGTSDPSPECPHSRMMQDGCAHSGHVEEKQLQGVFDITVSPLYDAEGHIRACVHVARDITEQKRAEENRLAMEGQFRQTQKLESLGVLAGGIAHDFNNILTAILGHCYMADIEIGTEIDYKDHIKQIEKAAHRAAELCRQMVSYAGKNSLLQTRINLWLMVDENVKMLRSALKKNVGIECDLRYAVPEVAGDSAQIQQVVMNLIINAAEAIGDKNGTIRIALAKRVVETEHPESDFLDKSILPGVYACLTVSDNGCGMDEETRKRIFEPFFTTKFSGRGLGMSAALGIITSHGGALQLSSTPDAGTVFKVYFPSSNKTGAGETSQPAAFIPSIKVKGTILLVDDEESLRIIGSVLLKAMGFSVLTASNGQEALEIYREKGNGIDLILLDMFMPVLGGIDTYRIVRETSPQIPIVICSGCNADKIQDDIENDHYSAVIQKPYKPDLLRNTLMKFINMTE